MPRHQFDPGFPVECLRDVFIIARNGELVERKYEVIQHVCWFAGCAAAQLQPEPIDIYAMDAPGTLDGVVDMLGDLLPAEDAEAALSLPQLAMLLRLALELLKYL